MKSVLITLVIILSIGVFPAEAVPAYPGLILYKQSNGTLIKIRVIGDEYENKIVSEEGFTLISGIDGDYYFAELSKNGTLVPSKVKAKPYNTLSNKESSYINKIPKGVRATAPIASPLRRMHRPNPISKSPYYTKNGELSAPIGINSSSPRIGKVKSLVILVEFLDTKFSMTDPKSAFNDMLNAKGYSSFGATGSASDYYLAASSGKFDPQFVVTTPVQLPKTASYYAGPTGTLNAPEMAQTACKLADDQIDFSEFSDDGNIRDVFIFYAGYNKAEGTDGTIWPHRYSPGTPIGSYDGNDLLSYACSSEFKGALGAKMAGIGTFCHEFGHILGWCDMYDTNGSETGNSRGLDYFSLMSFGSYLNEGRTPPPPTMLERWMAGWASPEIIKEEGAYSLPPVNEDKGYLIEADEHNEYFMIDYRDANSTKWDKYLGNIDQNHKGFYITHIDFTEAKQRDWDFNLVNANDRYELVKLIRSYIASENAAETLFPGTRDSRTLTSKTNKNYMTWSKHNMGFEIFNMKSNDKSGSFTVRSFDNQGKTRIELSPIINNRYNLVLISVEGDHSVKWNVNGEELKDNKVTFDISGTYTVQATITLASGKKQHIIKYVEINN